MSQRKRIVSAVILQLLSALPAAAQRRPDAPRFPSGPATMRIGLAVGAAGVDVRRSREPWGFGPLLGARWSWTRQRSGALVTLDVQPFHVDAGGTTGRYRAVWLLPAWEIRAGAAAIRVGIGVGMFRFEQALFDDRTDFAAITGFAGSVRLPSSFALEIGWRRTGIVRGFQSSILSLQLTRMWNL